MCDCNRKRESGFVTKDNNFWGVVSVHMQGVYSVKPGVAVVNLMGVGDRGTWCGDRVADGG